MREQHKGSPYHGLSLSLSFSDPIRWHTLKADLSARASSWIESSRLKIIEIITQNPIQLTRISLLAIVIATSPSRSSICVQPTRRQLRAEMENFLLIVSQAIGVS